MSENLKLVAYSDERGNRVLYDGPHLPDALVKITFKGSGNTVKVGRKAKIVHLTALFEGDNATLEIGSTLRPRTGLRFKVRLGHDTLISIGQNVGAQSPVFICVAEGHSVTIGNDCMLSSSVEIRADDSHPIYDVRTSKRVNPAGSVTIGDHVWIGRHVALLGGAEVCSGSVIGFRSVVKSRIPNNAIAVGSPAKVVRKNIAWERPSLSRRPSGIEGVPDNERKSEAFWELTQEEPLVEGRSRKRKIFGWGRGAK